MNQPNAFQYTRLKTGDIRLLEILPRKKCGLLHCQLHHYRLEHAPPFTALSYRWGDELPLRHVQINDSALWIRDNAAHALRQLRGDAFCRYLWIDCICINQSDDTEKSEQVGIMSTIFPKAHCVVAWLGREDPLIGIAFDSLRQFAALDTPYTSSDMQRICTDIEPLLANEYWMRLWVFQEVAFGASITVMCGEFRLLWHLIDDCIGRLRAYMTTLHHWSFTVKEKGIVTLQLIHRMATSRRRPPSATDSQSAKLSLYNLLEDYRESLCSDPRDNMFGLLSVLNDHRREQGRRSLLPDYRLSTTQLAIIYSAHILREEPWRKMAPVTVFMSQLLGIGLTPLLRSRNGIRLKLSVVETGKAVGFHEPGLSVNEPLISERPHVYALPRAQRVEEEISIAAGTDVQSTFTPMSNNWNVFYDKGQHDIKWDGPRNGDIVCRPVHQDTTPSLILRRSDSSPPRIELIGVVRSDEYFRRCSLEAIPADCARVFTITLDVFAALSLATMGMWVSLEMTSGTQD